MPRRSWTSAVASTGCRSAIELAAARVGLLGSVGVRDRLADRLELPGRGVRDAPARQRTLRDTIAWSHDLLDEPGRHLFAALAVFTGGCRPEELEAVIGSDVAGVEALDAVAALVDQSLVRVDRVEGHVRFDMLETIRADAAERFERAADRGDIRRRHALAYLQLAEAAQPLLLTRGRARAMARLTPERDNLRAAIRWAVELGEAEVGLRFATALGWFWGHRGEIDEARTTIATVLAIPGADAPSQPRMRALEAAGTIDYYGSRMDSAAARYTSQLELARELGDRIGTADALFNLLFTRPPSEIETIMPLLEEADAIYREEGDERGLARVMWTRGAGLQFAGQEDAAAELWRRSHALSRADDDVTYETLAASSLGAVALSAGRSEEAVGWYIDALITAREIGDVVGMTLSLPIAARAAADLVGPEPAATMLGAYETLTRRYGISAPPGLTAIIRQIDPMASIAAQLDPATVAAAMERGRAMDPEEAAEFVITTVRSLGSRVPS